LLGAFGVCDVLFVLGEPKCGWEVFMVSERGQRRGKASTTRAGIKQRGIASTTSEKLHSKIKATQRNCLPEPDIARPARHHDVMYIKQLHRNYATLSDTKKVPR
jgi:hypothetical protein